MFDLQLLAADIREEFIRRKRKAIPYFKFNDFQLRKESQHFERAAVICAELGAEPLAFVEAQMCDSDPRKFFPAFLHSKLAVEKYNAYFSGFDNAVDYGELFDVQLSYVVRRMEANQLAAEEVLMDDSVDLSPWFRCVLLQPTPARVAQKYGAIAALQLKDERIQEMLRSKQNGDAFYR